MVQFISNNVVEVMKHSIKIMFEDEVSLPHLRFLSFIFIKGSTNHTVLR